MNVEYGLVFYDIPTGNTKLYHKVHRLMRRNCLPVNLSVCLFDWGLKDHIKTSLEDMGAFSNSSIQLIKFDTSSKEQIEAIATKQLEKVFQVIQANLASTISRLNNIEKKEEYLDRVTRKLKDYENVLMLYSFANRVGPALNILKQTVATEYKFLQGSTI